MTLPVNIKRAAMSGEIETKDARATAPAKAPITQEIGLDGRAVLREGSIVERSVDIVGKGRGDLIAAFVVLVA